MTDQMSVETVKAILRETMEVVNQRQTGHEQRTAKEVRNITRSIEKVADQLAETNAQQAETNKQLAETNAQFVKWEERHFNYNEKLEKLDKKQEVQGQELRGLKEEQIHDTITRKATIKIAVIILGAAISGGFAFAWWFGRTMVTALIEAAKIGATP